MTCKQLCTCKCATRPMLHSAHALRLAATRDVLAQSVSTTRSRSYRHVHVAAPGGQAGQPAHSSASDAPRIHGGGGGGGSSSWPAASCHILTPALPFPDSVPCACRSATSAAADAAAAAALASSAAALPCGSGRGSGRSILASPTAAGAAPQAVVALCGSSR